MSKYGPVDARVFVHSPNIWYQRIEINKGFNDDVHRGDPVINGAGLVGKVEDATGGSAIVTLITDQSFATGVYVGDGRVPGSVTPAVGAPGDLLFEPVDANAKVREGDYVYTAGTTDDRLRSRATRRRSRRHGLAHRPRQRRPRAAHPRQARGGHAAAGHGAGADQAEADLDGAG